MALLAASLVVLARGSMRWFGGNEDAAASSPAREELLARARVFLPAEGDPRPVPALSPDAISCAYVPSPLHGTTPKFDCRLADGRVVKVKYGDTPEIHTEIAATQILARLGFASDRVQMIRRLECQGCPPTPFRLKQVADLVFAAPLVDRLGRPNRVRTFDWTAVEQKVDAQPVEEPIAGWQWSELDRVDATKGGAPRADLDALRRTAVLLADWDNKAENQRLICLDRPARSHEAGRCEMPLLMLQDVGATFGPLKLDLNRWRAAPVWQDSATCLTTMSSLPYGGATFVPARISEAVRTLLAARLASLGTPVLREIFTSARFPDPSTGTPGDVSAWIQVFQEKMRLITDRPPCPSVP